MHNFSINLIWAKLQMAIATLGSWLGYYIGGVDGVFTALVLFVTLDYITGVMCAIVDKKLSSEIGFRGIFKKMLIFMLVGIANVLDVNVIGSGSAIRTAVICFYLSNEGVSIIENAAHLGLPIPKKLKDILAQLHGRDEEKKEET